MLQNRSKKGCIIQKSAVAKAFCFTYQEGITAVTADHSHPLRLDGQRRLGGLLLWDHHHRAQVDDASAVEGTKRSLWFQRGRVRKTMQV